jgi:sec-independent protein translocase protein TatA
MIVHEASIFQPEHMLMILAIVVLLFGGKKIPELMRGVGEGVREFNAAKSNIKQEIEQGMKEKPAQPRSNTTTPVTGEQETTKA